MSSVATLEGATGSLPLLRGRTLRGSGDVRRVENFPCFRLSAQKAASYLSSCVVSVFNAFGHRDALPNNAIVAASALILFLEFESCRFEPGDVDTLSATLNRSIFQSLVLIDSSLPGTAQLNVCVLRQRVSKMPFSLADG